jgi:hypothetical protein
LDAKTLWSRVHEEKEKSMELMTLGAEPPCFPKAEISLPHIGEVRIGDLERNILPLGAVRLQSVPRADGTTLDTFALAGERTSDVTVARDASAAKFMTPYGQIWTQDGVVRAVSVEEETNEGTQLSRFWRDSTGDGVADEHRQESPGQKLILERETSGNGVKATLTQNLKLLGVLDHDALRGAPMPGDTSTRSSLAQLMGYPDDKGERDWLVSTRYYANS